MPHAGIAREIQLDILRCGGAIDAELARQAEGRHAVDQAEVDGLGRTALVGADLVGGDAEYFGGGGAVDVLVGGERAQQSLITRQVRHDPQFDLRVIGRQQQMAGGRDESLADAPSLGTADRDVLQVGIGRTQAPGRRHRLVVRGVHAPRRGVDLQRQFLGVGRAQLGERAILEDQFGQGVFEGQFLEHVLGGRRLAGRRLAQYRDLQLLEQDLLQLLGRFEVEILPGLALRLCRELDEAHGQLAALLLQHRAVDEHAAALHALQYRHQRLLDLLVEPGQRRHGLELRPQFLVQPQRDVGVFRGVLGRSLDAHLVEADLLGALAGDVLEMNGADAEVFRGHRVHVVARRRAVEHIGLEHGVVALAAQRDAVIGEHVHVEFHVRADLGVVRVLKQRTERGEHALALELVGRAGIAVRQR